MKLRNTTAVPNIFFDTQMKELSGSAMRVYLKIIRNLLGWRNENGEVKIRDWVAHSQFEKATGLSNRSVTIGVQELLDKQLISVTDHIGNNIEAPQKRKNAKRVYYSLVLDNTEKTTFYNEKTKEKPPQFMRTTEINSLQKKEYNVENENPEQKGRLTDRERIQRIIEQEKRKQLQRDSWT